MERRIYKSEDDKVFAGVCGGIAEYFNLDPLLVRVPWAILSLAYGSGLLLYIVFAILLPKRPYN